ncbi:tyrosine-type recombinase/integrase, partial [Nonomuraea fuscirosea]
MRPAELDRLTVAEAADRYVELVRARTLTGALSPATAEVYARDVGTLVELAGADVVLDDLTGADVDAILLAFARKPDGRTTAGRAAGETAGDRADDGAPGGRTTGGSAVGGRPAGGRTPAANGAGAGSRQSPSSQARFRRSISALFKHAALAGWVQLNPMTRSAVTAKERGGLRPERRALTREQAQGLIGAARELPREQADQSKRRDQRTELRDAVIVLLLTTVGPRVSELVRANVEDFFTNDGVRYWRIFGKGGRTRDVPLPGDVALVLQEYLARGRPDGQDKALLLSWRGRRLARGDVQAVI